MVKRASSATVFLALMWHHLMFYKRNKKKLCLKIIAPIAYVGVITLMQVVLLHVIAPSRIADKDSPKDNRAHVGVDGNDTRWFPHHFSKWPLNGTHPYRKFFDEQMLAKNQSNTKCGPGVHKALRDGWSCFSRLHGGSINSAEFNLLFGKIVFFPSNMENSTLITTLERMFLERDAANEKFFRIFANNTAATTTCFGSSVLPFPDKTSALKYVDKSLITSDMITGCTNYDEQSSQSFGPINFPLVMAVVDLSKYRKDKPEYTIIAKSGKGKGATEGEMATVVALDEAIHEEFGFRPLGIHSFARIKLDECLADGLRSVSGIVIRMHLIVAMMLIFPWYALDIGNQITEEKQGPKRRFLLSLGVKGFIVSISWLAYFLCLAVGLSLITATMCWVVAMEANFGMMFLVFFLTNIAMFSFIMMLIAISGRTTTHLTDIFTLIVCLGGMYVVFFLQDPSTFQGTKLTAVYASLLFFPSPVVLTSVYMGKWYMLGIRNFSLFTSPFQWDEFGGFGIALLFLLVDIVLYTTLAAVIEYIQEANIVERLFRRRKLHNSTPLDDDLRDVAGAHDDGAIKVVGVSKVYGEVEVLNDVNITFPGKNITAFLGENGAGKSTTTNIMTGYIKPNAGFVLYDGHDLVTNHDTIVQQLSYLPQTNILYDHLSLMEHIKFYGWLKGLTTKEITTAASELVAYDLQVAVNVLGTKLSGGQRRKLGIFVAYLGDPKYVILDEPTTGIDVFSARTIWDVILRKKGLATTLISTHRIEDAEVLADNVVIIDSGRIRAQGSPLELKEEINVGFSLLLDGSQMEPSARQHTETFITANLDLADNDVVRDGTTSTFKVMKEMGNSQQFVNCLRDLEKLLEDAGSGSYGVSDVSLGDVYHETLRKFHDNTKQFDISLCQEAYRTAVPKRVASQLATFLRRRALFVTGSFWKLLYYWLMPAVFAGFGGYVFSLTQGGLDIVSGPILEHQTFQDRILFASIDFEAYRNDALIVAAIADFGIPTKLLPLRKVPDVPANCHCANVDSTECKKLRNTLEESVTGPSGLQWVVRAAADNNVESSMYSSIYAFRKPDRQILATFMLGPVLNLTSNARLGLIEDHGFQSVAALMQMWENVTIRRNVEYGSVKHDTTFGEGIASIQVVLIQAMALTILLSLAKLFCTQDIKSGMKHLIDLSGASPVAYWSANLMADILQQIPALILVLVITETWFPIADNQRPPLYPLGIVMGTTFGYGMAIVSHGKGILVGSGIDYGMALLGLLLSLSHLGNSTSATIYQTMCMLLRVHPAFFCSETLMLSWLQGFSKDTKYFENQYYLALGTALVFTVINSLAVVAVEYRKCCVRCINKATVPPQPATSVDPDVAVEAETAKKLATKLKQRRQSFATQRSSEQFEDDVMPTPPVLAVGLTKIFKDQTRPAVADVTFSVKNSECFGLLGVNGAGKTTAFRMLTGLLEPDVGECYLDGVPFSHSPNLIFGKAMYCPQDDILCEYMTASQHTAFFAHLAGYPSDLSKQLQEMYKDALDVSKYNDRRVSKLSGGNKRKVQLISSIIGCPKVAFLDEPTTGLDPSARQLAWNVIGAIKKNASVILTSHSLDDCEALCDRLVIMVAGQFKCIGTVQYLKNKLGNKYTFRLKVSTDGQTDVREFILQKFEDKAILTDVMPNWMVYQIRAEDLGKISRLYEAFVEVRARFKVESTMVSQMSLQDVFFRMVREAEEQAMVKASN